MGLGFRKLVVLFGVFCLAALSSAQQHVKWTLAPKSGSANVLDLHAQIDPGWHLYSTVPVRGEGPVPTTITAKAPLVLSGPVKEGATITKLDPNFNLVVKFFQDSADFSVPVKSVDAKASVSVRFQLCNDSQCIPPAIVDVSVGGSSSPAPSKGVSATVATGDAYANSIAKAKQDGPLAFLSLALCAGFLSLLTPCVFPMIPITVSYFSKRKGSKEGVVGGVPGALAYCIGIIGTYAVVGIAVSAIFSSTGIQKFATNPLVNLALAALFVVLALSLLGILNLSLPSGLVNKFSGSQGKTGFVAPMMMGLTFTLTSFTCTFPFVGAILGGATSIGYGWAILGMVAYGAAFALPFFLLALFPQFLQKLPKSGAWLETVKAFMGFIEIAAALKFLSNADLVLRTNLISRPIFLGIWSLLAVSAGLFLLGAFKLPHVDRPTKIGPTRAVFGVATVALAGWLTFHIGGRTLGELEAFMPPTESGWIKDYQKALDLARKTNKPLFLNFTGVTCTNCRSMERNMFPQAVVKKELDQYVTVELYTDRETPGDEQNKALEEKLTGVVTLPEYVVLNPEGQKVEDFAGSTRNTDEFVGFLRKGTQSKFNARL